MDAPVDDAAYGEMSDGEVDDMESNDEVFFRANSELRSMRYAKSLGGVSGYWGWTSANEEGKDRGYFDEAEGKYMEELKAENSRGRGNKLSNSTTSGKDACLNTLG